MKLIIKEHAKKDLFIALFQLLKNCSSIINIIFSEKQLYIQGMDKSHVCLFDILLTNDWFDNYEIEDDDLNNISIIPQTINNILSSASCDHDIILRYEGDPDSLFIDLVTKESVKGEFSHYFKIPLTDNDSEILNIPETEYDAEFSINAKKMYDLASKMSLFGDSLNVVCDEEQIKLITLGVTGEMTVNIPIDDLSEYSIAEGDKINLTYSLNYIHKMCLTTKLSSDVEISVSKDCPMRIKYNLGDSSRVLFYLAPKIE